MRLGFQPPRHEEAASSGQVQVEHDDVGCEGSRRGHRGIGRIGDAHRHEPGFAPQAHAQAGSHRRVVIYHQHANHDSLPVAGNNHAMTASSSPLVAETMGIRTHPASDAVADMGHPPHPT